ncbi:hypothetical protein NRB16_02035 [Pseudomonas sp. LJDD11]|uniref:hypothetical protein n=1 Tax=Pseudomonas sp. LJDD11 TaxID=2931984 RepID=UPI00211CB57D|nr:hypothetical protein [Pseudomonas sp. LJDD11]MCQ9422308.1 hypothetical protein [Pseudomonas sp. LJDD11]
MSYHRATWANETIQIPFVRLPDKTGENVEYQRARLQYQYTKLRPIREGIFPQFGGNTEFELFSFFEICYHLKDWIKESSEYPSLSDVEAFINTSPALRVCADICNTLKHGKLRKSRSQSKLGVFKLKSTTTIYPYPGGASQSLDEAKILTERGDECCFALAEECMSEWERYFQENAVLNIPN